MIGVKRLISAYLAEGSRFFAVPADTDMKGELISQHDNIVYNIDVPTIEAMPYMAVDITRFIVSFQGLYNRDYGAGNSLLHITWNEKDSFWYEYMAADGNFLDGYKVINIQSEEEFWSTFDKELRACGLVLWDTAVPATANVAGTICGVDGYIPVKYDTSEGSLYNKLMEKGFEVKYTLVDKFNGTGKIPETDLDSTGSTKCDAYLWAMEKYLDKCSNRYIAYTLDGAGCIPGNPVYENAEATTCLYNQIYNHDYFVEKKMFFFDLTINKTEAPNDDPNQPLGTDAATIATLLARYYDQRNGELAQLIGFPPWHMKYTTFHGNGNMHPVDLEWAFTKFINGYNLIKEADAHMDMNWMWGLQETVSVTVDMPIKERELNYICTGVTLPTPVSNSPAV